MASLVGSVVWQKERQHLAREDSALAAAVRLEVPAGGRAVTYPLPDGSRVTLAPGSVLTSRGHFGDSLRTLDLTGEALFTVTSAAVPFIVYAAGVRMRDVSTTFAVRAMPAGTAEPPRALVVVTEGELQVNAGAWAGAVREGEAITVDSTGAHASLGAHALKAGVAWTSGALLFVDEPLSSVVERLARWTGLSIDLDPALRDRRVSLTLEGDAPERALEQVAAAIGARAESQGGRWRFVTR